VKIPDLFASSVKKIQQSPPNLGNSSDEKSLQPPWNLVLNSIPADDRGSEYLYDFKHVWDRLSKDSVLVDSDEQWCKPADSIAVNDTILNLIP